MKKQMTRVLILALTVSLLLCSGCKPKEPAAGSSQSGGAASSYQGEEMDWENTVVYDGTTYHRRNDLKTVLFLGVDNTARTEAAEGIVGNNGRSDTMILFILDNTNRTNQVFSISRNCMTDVDIYSGDGELFDSVPMQINMQYAYGNSARRSNFLTARTLSEMLYNTDIDYTLSLTMDGINTIVNWMGGITLTMAEDYSYVDPSYVKGATVTLDGAAAERFIRYRDVEEAGSNEVRLDRQSWFIHEMFRQMKASGVGSGWLEKLLEIADPYIEMDLDGETIKKLTDYTMLDETLKVPGSNQVGAEHDEFYVDEEALQELILQTFYEPVS